MLAKYFFSGLLLQMPRIDGVESQTISEFIQPHDVEFQSFNFNNTLHWKIKQTHTSHRAVYFVQYKMYGQNWKNKEECWGIQEDFCDLTNETSAVRDPYYGRVKAALAGVSSGWSISSRFNPWWDTKVGPPSHIRVSRSNGLISVTFQAPNSPYKSKNGSNIPMSNYHSLSFQVYQTSAIHHTLEKIRKKGSIHSGSKQSVFLWLQTFLDVATQLQTVDAAAW
ncbi:interleukin-22 receptor subunit alpha-2 isoform X2 [Ornithorhynchus anatinus]|uniref:interleukin-22 receptor subunit alpha-2 isoform X2 n=1 Tax=Ornithorhynchus anatinus TaxID=9258 RepID=UPI0010A7A317|nr:interleukin-22 receptor subunit alpha-2 isoform X2 [Ornithorhynchus anatinus]